MDHPLSIFVTRPTASSQRIFASEAMDAMPDSDKVSAEPSDNGLTIRALTELDLELAVWEVRKRFADVLLGKPQVNYKYGTPILEPYYLATIDAPEDALAGVVADLSTRRGTVVSVDAGPIGKRLRVEIPVSETFGYFTVLQILTRKRSDIGFEFLDYRRAGGYGEGEAIDVA